MQRYQARRCNELGGSSITDEQHAVKWKLKAIAGVERVKEPADSFEVIAPAVEVPDSYRELSDVGHHACLEEILEELVVDHSSACFDLDHHAGIDMMGVGVKGLLKNTI